MFFRILLFTLIAVILISCNVHPDKESLKKELVELHKQDIQDHLEKNISGLTDDIAEDYLSVSNGSIREMSQSDMENMFTNYFGSTEFSIYKDLEEPIVGIADDGSLGWIIVQVRVAGNRTTADSTSIDFDSRWAWLSIYGRKNNEWIRKVDVSTLKPFEG